jgi:hypothetical protein
MKRMMTILLIGTVAALYSTVSLAAKCKDEMSPQKKLCAVAGGGKGIKERTCDDGKWSKFGECKEIVCPPGKTLEEGDKKPKCVGKIVRECTEDGSPTPCHVAHGMGEKTRKCTPKGKWGGWNKCQLKECNPGFAVIKGKCKKIKNPKIPEEIGFPEEIETDR